MDNSQIDIAEIHLLLDMLQTIDVGLVVVDRGYHVQVWNTFMANHNGRKSDAVMGKSLFELFPEIQPTWFRHKAESVFQLKSRAFMTWEQRPYLFRFKNYRPITGTAEFMYQNVTFIPLVSMTGEVEHMGMIVYDVTDIAVNKRQLKNANARLEDLSRTDALTKLNNRGHFEECLRSEFQRLKRISGPCCMVMFDIDHFKKVNDTYGHQAGDEVIRVTANALRESVRETDITGRYGGEEFSAILVNTPADKGMIVAERLRERCENSLVRHDGHDIRFTISVGIADFSEEMGGYPQWIENADKALYEAKRTGRNRSLLYTPQITG